MVHGGILGKESPNRNLNPDQKIGLEPELGVQNNLSPVDEEMMNDTEGHLEKASTYTKTIVSPQNYEKLMLAIRIVISFSQFQIAFIFHVLKTMPYHNRKTLKISSMISHHRTNYLKNGTEVVREFAKTIITVKVK